MSRWLPAVAAGCAIALVGLVATLVLRPAEPVSPADRAGALASELRCPDCQGLSVADSPTAAAQEIRRQIDDLVAGGATDDEVRDHFVTRYGEWILLAPRAGVAWIVPFAAALVGVAALGLILLRRRPVPASPLPVTDAERRRVHDEAEALDA